MAKTSRQSGPWHDCPREDCEKSYWSIHGLEQHLARDHELPKEFPA